MDWPAIFTETVVLRNDNGTELRFQGRMFSECSYYDAQSSTLTRIRLYATGDGHHVYSFVSGAGERKSRRHYEVFPGKESCRISDGVHAFAVPTEMLFAAVFGLCGIEAERAEELRPSFEESLLLAAGA